MGIRDVDRFFHVKVANESVFTLQARVAQRTHLLACQVLRTLCSFKFPHLSLNLGWGKGNGAMEELRSLACKLKNDFAASLPGLGGQPQPPSHL